MQKYQLLINKRESTGLKYCKGPKALIEYSNYMNTIHKNIEEYNTDKERKMYIVFDDTIVDMFSKEKLNPIVTELFIRGTKVNISFAFITKIISYFIVLKNIRLNSTYNFFIKIENKQELQQTAFNQSADLNYGDFMNLYKKCTAQPYSFLVIDTNLTSDNALCFRKIFLERI